MTQSNEKRGHAIIGMTTVPKLEIAIIDRNHFLGKIATNKWFLLEEFENTKCMKYKDYRIWKCVAFLKCASVIFENSFSI